MMNGHMGSFINGYGYSGPSGLTQFGMMPYFNSSTLIFIVLIAIGVYFLMKNQSLSKANSGNIQSIEAEEMAKLRYARGEITLEEFQQILKTIKS
jgi:putative membrane protein